MYDVGWPLTLALSPPFQWPKHGAVDVKNLEVRYAPELPAVLHDLSFSIKPQEKVGVVGTTGSGKSTLALSFFRFVEATKGSIVIDNIDISDLGTEDLRSRLTIIPQGKLSTEKAVLGTWLTNLLLIV